MLALFGLAVCAVVASGASLVDHPIVGDSVTYLDGAWALNGAGLSLKGNVPGDLMTDLQTSGAIPDPLFELNWKNSSLWDDNVWTYSTTFAWNPPSSSGELLLAFDGIKMGANITLNGHLIGTAEDQYLRYVFPLKATGFLVSGTNTIAVAFDKHIPVDGRFMACTGGWDWVSRQCAPTPMLSDSPHTHKHTNTHTRTGAVLQHSYPTGGHEDLLKGHLEVGLPCSGEAE